MKGIKATVKTVLQIVMKLFFWCLLLAFYAAADTEVLDAADNQVDHSLALSETAKGSWLPVPIPMSNPTLGSGLQLSLLYLHASSPGQDEPNATSGLAGLYTDNDSKGLGIFHDSSVLEDRFRLRAMIGRAEFNLDFFGIGEDLLDFSTQYTMKADTVYLQGLTRITKTLPWYLGLRYFWLEADISSELFDDVFPMQDLEIRQQSSNLALVLNFDSRNDNYYPSKGQLFEVVLSRDDKNWGSDFEFNKNSSTYTHYRSFYDHNVLALHADLSDLNGRAPFYLLPGLNMRGFANGRYRNNTAFSVHAEWRYKFLPRWGIVGFLESGRTGRSVEDLIDEKSITSYGVGFRWQVTADKLLNLSIDFAFSDDEDAIYLRIGESF